MKFWKMNGAGNDFIIINNIEERIDRQLLPRLAERLCERRLSIGADGLMAVERAEDGGDYRMLFFNSDGSLGEMCGNGARCICRYGYENGLAGETQRVETTAGLVTGERIDARNYRVRLNNITRIEPMLRLDCLGRSFECAYVELGSPGLPHLVVNADTLDADTQLRAVGAALRSHPALPKGANVNFYRICGDNEIELTTYERGVEDFTYACGTGSGSTVAVLALKNLVSGRNTAVKTKGGLLHVNAAMNRGEVSELLLTGPTNIAAKGVVCDEEINFV